MCIGIWARQVRISHISRTHFLSLSFSLVLSSSVRHRQSPSPAGKQSKGKWQQVCCRKKNLALSRIHSSIQLKLKPRPSYTRVVRELGVTSERVRQRSRTRECESEEGRERENQNLLPRVVWRLSSSLSRGFLNKGRRESEWERQKGLETSATILVPSSSSPIRADLLLHNSGFSVFVAWVRWPTTPRSSTRRPRRLKSRSTATGIRTMDANNGPSSLDPNDLRAVSSEDMDNDGKTSDKS